MSASAMRTWTTVAALLLALGCGGSDESELAAVTRACNDARNACVQTCSSGGNYVPEPCKAACEKGRELCSSANEAPCESFRNGCNDGCGNDRCSGACDAGYDACDS